MKKQSAKKNSLPDKNMAEPVYEQVSEADKRAIAMGGADHDLEEDVDYDLLRFLCPPNYFKYRMSRVLLAFSRILVVFILFIIGFYIRWHSVSPTIFYEHFYFCFIPLSYVFLEIVSYKYKMWETHTASKFLDHQLYSIYPREP